VAGCNTSFLASSHPTVPIKRAGQDTYLTSTSSDWFAWDGEQPVHASRFPTAELALAAAHTCRGPIFRLPDPASFNVIKLDE
jgi:hypothetical protein